MPLTRSQRQIKDSVLSPAIESGEVSRAIEAALRGDVFASEEISGDGLVGSVGEMDAIKAQVVGSFGVVDHGEVHKFAVISYARLPTLQLGIEVVFATIATNCLQGLRHICVKNSMNHVKNIYRRSALCGHSLY